MNNFRKSLNEGFDKLFEKCLSEADFTRHAELEVGKTYTNKNGSDYKVLSGSGDTWIMRQPKSGWTFTAHVITMYDDGQIEWDYSTDGTFDKVDESISDKWLYNVEPRKINNSSLYYIVNVDTGDIAYHKRFETYEETANFIKRNARYNNWLAGEKKDFVANADKLTDFGKKIKNAKINEGKLADRVKKNDLDYDDEVDALYAKDDDKDIMVQFQDREQRTHFVSDKDGKPSGEKHPRVSSNTWGRVWNKGDFKQFRGPKYVVRKDVAKYLDKIENESLNESSFVSELNDYSDDEYNALDYMYQNNLYSKRNDVRLENIDIDEIAYEFDLEKDRVKELIDELENKINNTEFYYEDWGLYIQLSDNHTLRQVKDGVDMDFYYELVNDALAEFKKITDKNIYALGRSDRHICVDSDIDNLYDYDELKNIQQQLEKDVIEKANQSVDDAKNESYDLLSGTHVEQYRDYNKAKARAKELGLKEAEYGDAYGVSYCFWNKSGDRNEDEEVIAYYKFRNGKPVPLSDDEAEKIARRIYSNFDDLDESLENMTIEDMFKAVGVKRVFDKNAHFTKEAESKYNEVAKKFFGGNLDKLDKLCDEENCFNEALDYAEKDALKSSVMKWLLDSDKAQAMHDVYFADEEGNDEEEIISTLASDYISDKKIRKAKDKTYRTFEKDSKFGLRDKDTNNLVKSSDDSKTAWEDSLEEIDDATLNDVKEAIRKAINEFGYYNFNEGLRKVSKKFRETKNFSANIPQKNNLKRALDRFDKNGNLAKQGAWKIAKGGYDKAFEVYYNEMPIITAEVGPSGSTEIKISKADYDGNNTKDVADFICSVYKDCSLKEDNESCKPSKHKKKLAEAKAYGTPFEAYITNLGKYNEGELVGKWVPFPVSKEYFDDVLKEIGINDKYEEWFVTDYDSEIDGLSKMLDEYTSFAELNRIAEKLNEYGTEELSNVMEVASDIDDAMEGIDEGRYQYYPGIFNDTDLGQYWIDEVGFEGISNPENYFDYESFGRDVRLEYSPQDEDDPETAGELYCGDEDASDEDIGYECVQGLGGIEGLGKDTIENYFDVEKLGRDISFDGYTFTSDGCVYSG